MTEGVHASPRYPPRAAGRAAPPPRESPPRRGLHRRRDLQGERPRHLPRRGRRLAAGPPRGHGDARRLPPPAGRGLELVRGALGSRFGGRPQPRPFRARPLGGDLSVLHPGDPERRRAPPARRQPPPDRAARYPRLGALRLLRFPPAHGGGGREIARPAAGLRLRRPAAPRRRLVRRDAAAGRHGARHRGGLARRDLPLDRHLGERLSRRRADRRGAPVRRLPDRDQPRAHPLLPAGAPLPARAGRGGPSRLDGGDPGMPATEYLIRELPLTERPRERLLEQGSGALSDVELVAVLLRTGRVGCSALQMALDLLCETAGLGGLLGLSPEALKRSGLGPAKAASLLAAIELGRRLAREEIGQRDPIAGPRDVVRYLALRYGTRDQEVMGALFLDARRRLMGEREIYRGTLDRAVVEPREVLK